MAYNGAGLFVRLYSWVTDRNAGIKIRADRMDAEMNGFAAGLSNCMTLDGQSTPTQNIPMGTKRFTGLGAGVDPNDSVRMQQLTDALSPGYSNIGDYLTTLRNPGASWLKRNGQTILQTAYADLFALIGQSFNRPSGFNALSPAPHSGNLYTIAYGAGKLVIGGNAGVIRYSANNGTSWSGTVATGLAGSINALCYGNSLFVAVDSAGGIATAADPAGPWTVQTSGSSVSFYAVAFANGRFVAVGIANANVAIYTSPDAVAWSPRAITSFTATLKGVAYGNGVWIAVGVGGVAVISRDNGSTWIVSNVGTTGDLRAIAFGKGRFVTVGNKFIGTSTSGNAWKPQGAPTDILAIASGPSGFAAVSYSYSTSSTDGENWTTHTATTQLLNAVCYGADAYYAVDANGLGSKSVSSCNVVTEFQVPDDGADIDYIKAL